MNGRARRGVTLSVRLVLATSALLAAALSASAYYSLRTLESLARTQAEAQRADHEAAIRRDTQRSVRYIGSAAAIPLAESNYPYVEEIAKGAVDENEHLRWILVYDRASGEVVARTRAAPNPAGQHASIVERLRAQPMTNEVLEMRDGEATTYNHVFGANIYLRDEVLGHLLLGISTAALERAKVAAIARGEGAARASARKQLFMASAILLLGIVVGVYQGTRITRPLKALSEQAHYIASGDFAQRAEVATGGEIGQLAESFNTMAESLEGLLRERTLKASLERECELAREVQRRLSPPERLLSFGACSVIGRSDMADACGGDWWTYRELPDGTIVVLVGDVTGHGVPAAMVAATASGAVAVASPALEGADAARLEHLLEAVHRSIADIPTHSMTCFALEIGPHGLVRYANAGHTCPYVIRRDEPAGSRIEALIARSNPLGSQRLVIGSGSYRLRSGDVIMLTSDGVADRLNAAGERFGDRRLRKLLCTMGGARDDVLALRDEIVGALDRFAAGSAIDDDMTLVLVEYRATELGLQRGDAA
jgi:serine phosphatase RsbU (regulator of sigma subunit)